MKDNDQAKTITAKEARQITGTARLFEHGRANQAAEVYLPSIMEKINDAASRGKDSVVVETESQALDDAIMRLLSPMGYTRSAITITQHGRRSITIEWLMCR